MLYYCYLTSFARAGNEHENRFDQRLDHGLSAALCGNGAKESVSIGVQNWLFRVFDAGALVLGERIDERR